MEKSKSKNNFDNSIIIYTQIFIFKFFIYRLIK